MAAAAAVHLGEDVGGRRREDVVGGEELFEEEVVEGARVGEVWVEGVYGEGIGGGQRGEGSQEGGGRGVHLRGAAQLNDGISADGAVGRQRQVDLSLQAAVRIDDALDGRSRRPGAEARGQPGHEQDAAVGRAGRQGPRRVRHRVRHHHAPPTGAAPCRLPQDLRDGERPLEPEALVELLLVSPAAARLLGGRRHRGQLHAAVSGEHAHLNAVPRVQRHAAAAAAAAAGQAAAGRGQLGLTEARRAGRRTGRRAGCLPVLPGGVSVAGVGRAAAVRQRDVADARPAHFAHGQAQLQQALEVG